MKKKIPGRPVHFIMMMVCLMIAVTLMVSLPDSAGKTWNEARLQEPVLDKAHTWFRYLWQWSGDSTEILSRAIDETGYVQPTLRQLVEARGTDLGGYHMNPVTAWQIKSDGSVLFKPESWK